MAYWLPWNWFSKVPPGAAMKRRLLVLDRDKCIGCEACTNVCPAGLITFSDQGLQRTLRIATLCSEDCTRCAEACSEAAIALTAAPRRKPAQQYQTAVFELLACRDCGGGFTTRRVVDKLWASLPKELGATPEELGWLGLCPACRKASEAGSLLAKGALAR